MMFVSLCVESIDMRAVSLCVESIDMRANKRVGVCLQELLCIITPPGVRGRLCVISI